MTKGPVIEPPHPIPAEGRAVFLAGSIEMGVAERWQDDAAEELSAAGLIVLNPRRRDWNPSWRQEIGEPRFREQVEWELNGMERADGILMYFAPETRSPVSLLELGKFADSGKLVVCCPEGFWRKGNVDIVCAHYGVFTSPTLANAVQEIKKRLTE